MMRSVIDKDRVILITKATVVIFGFSIVLHMFAATNYMINHDSLLTWLNNGNWLITQGKWFVTPLASVEGAFSIPFLSMLIGLVALSVASIVVCLIYDIKKPSLMIIIGLCIVSFPSFATASIYQSVDYFGLAFLGATLSALFLIRGESLLEPVIGVIVLVLTIGAYQAYLGVTIALLVTDCLQKTINNKPFGETFKCGIKYIIELIISVGLYWVILKIALIITSLSLSSYKGMDNVAGNLRPSVLFNSVFGAYRDVYRYYIRNCFDVYKHHFSVLGILLLCIVGVVLFLSAKRSGAIYSVKHCILSAFLILCLPLSVNVVGVLTANQSFYYISIAPFVVLLIVPIVVFNTSDSVDCKENTCDETKYSHHFWRSLGCFIAILAVCFSLNWGLQNNVAYYKLYLINKEIEAKMIELATRIQSTDGYKNDSEIVYIGEPPYAFLASTNVLNGIEKFTNTSGYGITDAKGVFYMQSQIDAYFGNVLSIDLRRKEEPTEEELRIGKELNIYPESGSICSEDNTIIVRLSK